MEQFQPENGGQALPATPNDSRKGSDGWLTIHHPQVIERLGSIQHALFDFDGTLSVLRQGWEEVMIPLMVEKISGQVDNPCVLQEIEREVREYVDRSSGILTIRQMQWLADTVERYGLLRPAELARPALTARQYKAIYLERLMVRVGQRIARLVCGETSPEEAMVAGAEAFLRELKRRGARLYLASGTDHADILREAAALGLLPYFDGGVYGALDENENHAKERVIQRILDENGLAGEALLVVGDGPVEIREGAARGALTLGIASDEEKRSGWNTRKTERLVQAGADLLAADFSQAALLAQILYREGQYGSTKSHE